MEVDDLTEEQANALSRFREFTHIDSVETCRQFLAAHDWDVERAIDTALISDSEPISNTIDDNRATTDFLPSAPPVPAITEPITPPRTNGGNRITTNDRSPNMFSQLFGIILSFFYAFYLKLEPFIPWTIFHVILSFFQSLLLSPRPVDHLQQIENYCNYFDNQYGTTHPPFYRGRLAQALRDTQREVRLLFIYLHDKNSPLCDRFCREVLCEDTLRSIIADNLLWSASTDTQEGAQVSRLLHVNTFPCFCIVAHRGSQQTVQLKLERYEGADEFLAEVINGVQNANVVLEYNREQRNSRNSRDRLLEEQNAAYLDSVRADQEKAEKRKREEDEKRKIEEDERRLHEEKQKKLNDFAKFREIIKNEFPEEPLPTETDTIQVSIRLPDNEPIRRRFRLTDSAKLLFHFAWTNSNVPDHFELLWGYPRKRYQYGKMTDQQIQNVMNGNSETCYLEQTDDDVIVN